MLTALETWNQTLNKLVEIYPYVGIEMMLALARIASWIIWHSVQIKMNNTILEEDMVFKNKAKRVHARRLSAAESTL
jgi:hypothetical protein